MSIFDTLKKFGKKGDQKKPTAETPVAARSAGVQRTQKKIVEKPKQVQEPVAKTIREEIEAGKSKPKKGQALGVYAHHILIRPIVSEKSTYLHESNQYVFLVSPRANKISVKKAIFDAYNVEPTDVRIVTMQGKSVRYQVTHKGHRSAYKKAIIRLPKGTSLPVYEGV